MCSKFRDQNYLRSIPIQKLRLPGSSKDKCVGCYVLYGRCAPMISRMSSAPEDICLGIRALSPSAAAYPALHQKLAASVSVYLVSPIWSDRARFRCTIDGFVPHLQHANSRIVGQADSGSARQLPLGFRV